MALRLILIGFMGSGKSVVGKLVARGLGWHFTDMDALVEEALGMSISEAFAARGEAGFRLVEEAVVTEFLDKSAQGQAEVVSLGGGAVTSKKVFGRLKEEPLVVLLDADLDTAFSRAQNGRRPLARDAARFKELYFERDHLYRDLAKLTIDTRGRGVEEVAQEVAARVKERIGIN